MRTIKTVDVDFTFKNTDYWYRAEVTIDYSSTPETQDSPEEESWEYDVNILEVEEYLGNYQVVEIELYNIDMELHDAIVEDAEKQAMEQLGEEV